MSVTSRPAGSFSECPEFVVWSSHHLDMDENDRGRVGLKTIGHSNADTNDPNKHTRMTENEVFT
eukprot:884265-Ditylum_brightwellii.AAC.1